MPQVTPTAVGQTTTLSRSLRGDLPRLSPSGAKTFLRCQRLWAYQYVDGIRDPQTASQRRGEVVHALVEDYLRHGTEPSASGASAILARMGGRWVDAGKGVQAWVPDEVAGQALTTLKYIALRAGDPDLIVKAARSLITARGADLRPRLAEAERHLERATTSAVWHGYADVLSFPGAVPVVGGHILGDLAVDDWKTTSNINAYAMDGADLLDDPQALIYAFCAAGETGQTSTPVSWNYVQMRGACKTRIASNVIETSRAEDAVALLDERVARPAWAIVRAGLTAAEVEPTGVETGACSEYGGCPRRAVCPLSITDKLRGLRAMSAQGSRPTLFESLGGGPSIGQTDQTKPAIEITGQSAVEVQDLGFLGERRETGERAVLRQSEPVPRIPPGQYAGVNRSTCGPEGGRSYLLRCSCKSGDDRDPACQTGLGTGNHPVGLCRDVLCECPEDPTACPVGRAVGAHGPGHPAEIVEWRDGITPVTAGDLEHERANASGVPVPVDVPAGQTDETAQENATDRAADVASKNPQPYNSDMTQLQNTAAAESAPPESATTQDVQQGPPVSGAYILCLDCAPRGAGQAPWGAAVIDATAIVREAARRAADLGGAVADYRLVEYGKGPGLLSACLSELLDESPARLPAQAIVTLDTRTPEAGHVLAVLVERAVMVIQ